MKKLLIAGIIPAYLLAATVSFEEALNDAFNNNNELKAKRLNVAIAKKDYEKAVSYSTQARIYFQETPVVMSSNSNAAKYYAHATGKSYIKNFNTRFVYEAPIFMGYKLKYAKILAKLQMQAKAYKFLRDKNKLAVEVLKAYNGAVAAKYFIKALKSAKRTTRSFVKMTKNMYKQGLVVSSDVYSAESRDSDVDAKMIEAKNQYMLALAYLRFLTGNKNITGVRDFKVIIPPTSDLGALQKEAIQHRTDLKFMKKNVETMKNKIRMDASAFYPQIGDHFEFGWDTDNLKLTKNKDYWIIGGRLTYYFVNPGVVQEYKKSKIQAHQTAIYYNHMKNGIALDVEQKYLNLKAKTALIKTKLKNARLAGIVLKQYKSMYKNGLINISILLLKQAMKQKADAELIKAKYDQAIAAAELQLAIGRKIGGIAQ